VISCIQEFCYLSMIFHCTVCQW